MTALARDAAHAERVQTRLTRDLTDEQQAAHRWLTEVFEPVVRAVPANLRRKLEPDPSRPRYLRTDPGLGYRFTPDSPTR